VCGKETKQLTVDFRRNFNQTNAQLKR